MSDIIPKVRALPRLDLSSEENRYMQTIMGMTRMSICLFAISTWPSLSHHESLTFRRALFWICLPKVGVSPNSIAEAFRSLMASRWSALPSSFESIAGMSTSDAVVWVLGLPTILALLRKDNSSASWGGISRITEDGTIGRCGGTPTSETEFAAKPGSAKTRIPASHSVPTSASATQRLTDCASPGQLFRDHKCSQVAEHHGSLHSPFRLVSFCHVTYRCDRY